MLETRFVGCSPQAHNIESAPASYPCPVHEEPLLIRSLWTIVLGAAVAAVVLNFARQPLFAGDGSASGLGQPLTLWVTGAEAGGEAEAVAHQAAGCWQVGARPVTVGVLSGEPSSAVATFLGQLHGASDDLLVITSSTLAKIAADDGTAIAPELREQAHRAIRLLESATPISVLGSDALTLAVPGSSPIHSSAQLLATIRQQPSQPVFGVADNPWLLGNLAELVQGAGLHGPMPYVLYDSSRQAVASVDSGAASVIVTQYSAIHAELRRGALRQLRWPAFAGPPPHGWVAVVAPSGLSGREIARLRAQAGRLCTPSAWRRLVSSDGLSPVASSTGSGFTMFMHDGLNEATHLEALAAQTVRTY